MTPHAKGFNAHRKGKSILDNPYDNWNNPKNINKHMDWNIGWVQAQGKTILFAS